MQRVSVITPTFNRAELLALVLKSFLSQTYQNIEWRILDDSDRPNSQFQRLNNHRIFYQHNEKRMSIGEKRNLLIEQSTGDVIVNFDDDDYYAPTYLAQLMMALQTTQADLLNLRGFFIYSSVAKRFAYWDMMIKEGLHFSLSRVGLHPIAVDESNRGELLTIHLGYGFGWIFKKQVWQRNPYPHINWNEDGAFAIKAAEQFKLDGLMDKSGLCLHFLHGRNSSACFPQYLLPTELMDRFFPLERINQFIDAGT